MGLWPERKIRNPRTRRAFLCLLVVGSLTGCTVGPNFQRPESPDIVTYTSSGLPEQKAVTVSDPSLPRFMAGQDIPAEWWKVFQSEELDKIIRLALADSPTLSAAQAKLREARENLSAKTGKQQSPSVGINGSAQRMKFSTASFGQPGGKGTIFNLFEASVKITYLLDVFGGGRRELEALAAQVDYERFQCEGAQLELTADIVAAVGKEVALRGQIKSMQDMAQAEEKQLQILEKQLQLGGVARSEVLAQKTLVENTRALLPVLEKELALTRHQLTLLVGKFPSEGIQLPEFHFADLKLPSELPVSLPSSFVRQRPDIRASEALLHSASAQVGVAAANMLPQIMLSASSGPQANTFSQLFNSQNNVWSLGAGLTEPIFNGGELKAKRRAAEAVFDQASAQYRQTVLLAFQNVADVLRALEVDGQIIKAEMAAEKASRETLELAQKQFKAGAVSYMVLLDAQRQYAQNQIGLIQAQATRFADTTALFQALGGGWWNRVDQTVVADQ